MNVTVYVSDALIALEENLKKHLEDYELQLAAWKLAYDRWLEAAKEYSNNQETTRPVEPSKPRNYEEDYARLIRKLMFHSHISDTITLDDREYNRIFEDEWGWRNNYITETALAAGAITSGAINSAKIGEAVIPLGMTERAQERLKELGYTKKVD